MTAGAARHAVAVLTVLCACLLSRWASAYDLPACGGHVTDTRNVLNAQTKKDADAKLDKLAHDALVDAPVWIADAPEGEDLETLGRLAYGQWRIGAAWDAGVLIVFPVSSRVLFIQDIAYPAFTPSEAALLRGVDQPQRPMDVRLATMTDAVVALEHAKIDLTRPAHQVRYVSGTVALLLTAIALTLTVRRLEQPAVVVEEKTTEVVEAKSTAATDEPAATPPEQPEPGPPGADEALPGA